MHALHLRPGDTCRGQTVRPRVPAHRAGRHLGPFEPRVPDSRVIGPSPLAWRSSASASANRPRRVSRPALASHTRSSSAASRFALRAPGSWLRRDMAVVEIPERAAKSRMDRTARLPPGATVPVLFVTGRHPVEPCLLPVCLLSDFDPALGGPLQASFGQRVMAPLESDPGPSECCLGASRPRRRVRGSTPPWRPQRCPRSVRTRRASTRLRRVRAAFVSRASLALAALTW